MVIRELISIRDTDFSPSTIACHDDLVYVGERASKQIRVYDKLLRLVRIVHLHGVIVSNHVALAVNQNVRVLMDGSDSLALFQQPIGGSQASSTPAANIHRVNSNHHHQDNSRRKFTLRPESNRASVCHFYTSMECLEDVNVAVDDDEDKNERASSIYAADSCLGQVKRFGYEHGRKIVELASLQIDDGTPVSVVANPLGHVFVLTDLPRRLLVVDSRECSRTAAAAADS